MRSRIIATLASIAAAALAWIVVLWLREPASRRDAGWERPAPGEHAGLVRLQKWRRSATESVFRRRPQEPTSSFSEEWILGAPERQDTEALLRAAESAVGLPDRLGDEQPGWADFYNRLTDPFFMHDVVLACGEEIRPTQRCYLGVRVVAAPETTEAGAGSVVQYSEIAGAEPDTHECRAYASCVADAMLGRELPAMPEGQDDPQGTEVTWHMDAWDDTRIQVNRDRITVCIETCKEALALLEDTETILDSVEAKRYQVGNYEARLAWCEMLLAELDGT